MENKEDKHFYHKLSKKELQDLCKKMGLPIHKTKSDLARSLVSSNEVSGDRVQSYNFSGFNLQQTSKFKSCEGDGSTPRSKGPGRSSANHILDLTKETGPSSILRHHKDMNAQLLPKEISVAPSMKYTTSVPSSSCEFHVSSEQGIKLCVNLNSSPVDWVKRLKDGIRFCDISQGHEAGHQKELGGIVDINKPVSNVLPLSTDSHQENNVIEQIRASPNLDLTEQQHGKKEDLDGAHGSLRSSSLQPCGNAVDIERHLRKCQKLVLSSRPSSTVPSRKYEEAFGLQSATLLRKPAFTPATETNSNAERCSVIREHQDSNNDHNHEKLVSQLTRSPIKHSMTIPRPVACETKQIMVLGVHSKDAPSPCKYGGFLNLADPLDDEERVRNVSDNSGKLSHFFSSNSVPTSADERERSNVVNGLEISEDSSAPFSSLDVDTSAEMMSSRSDNSESTQRIKRKEPCSDDQESDESGQYVQIIEKAKRRTSEILRRRSMRLVLKVANSVSEHRDLTRNIEHTR